MYVCIMYICVCVRVCVCVCVGNHACIYELSRKTNIEIIRNAYDILLTITSNIRTARNKYNISPGIYFFRYVIMPRLCLHGGLEK